MGRLCILPIDSSGKAMGTSAKEVRQDVTLMSSKNFCFLFLFIVFCVSALTNVVCPAQGNPKPLRYELDKVTLVGTIVSRTFYGPPNYGEDPKIDSKERQYILLLD